MWVETWNELVEYEVHYDKNGKKWIVINFIGWLEIEKCNKI